AGDPGVPQAVAALKRVEGSPRRLPAGIPDGLALLHVEEAPVVIHRVVVIAVTRQAAQAGILPEGVTAGRLRAEAVELVLAEQVQPGQRSVRARDDVFAVLVVEVAVGGHGRKGGNREIGNAKNRRGRRKSGGERDDADWGRDPETTKPGAEPGLKTIGGLASSRPSGVAFEQAGL